MPRHCLFCNEVDLTEEDIWPVWFKRWLSRHPKLKGTFTLMRFQDDETTILDPSSQTVGGKRRIMCERCNNTRLGPVQDAASVILKPMLDHPFVSSPDESIYLTASDQEVLAAWATMTAMTAEFIPQPMPDVDETFFTQEERVRFRDTLKPLREMHITASQYVGQKATSVYFAHPTPNILYRDTGERTGEVAQLFVVTVNLFHVCFQVAFYREPDLRFARDGSTLLGIGDIGVDLSELIVPLWPATKMQEYPAKYALGDDTFLSFCQRWNP